jgi:E-phenylitaconyl-CoA hydratase
LNSEESLDRRVELGLDYTTEGQIGFFNVDNPQTRNALDLLTLNQFKNALEHFNSNSQIRVGIVSGNGDQAFCSGIDIKDTLSADANLSLPPTLMRGLETNKPLIAAVNGAALGGGFELALACDIRIAVEQATFGFPEVKLGLIPAWGGTQRSVRQLTWAQSAALLLTGRTITAREAWQIGLINQLTTPSELRATARQWADSICQAAPLAVQAAKEAMQKGSQLSFDEGLQLEDALVAYLKTTADFKEGLKAFREHRQPDFKGE